MTYHLEPWIEKIISPVVLIYPDGEQQEYQGGTAIENKIFSKLYRITEIRAVNNRIELSLQSANVPDTESFF